MPTVKADDFPNQPWLTRFFLKWRWVLVVLFALPLGFLFEVAFQLRDMYMRRSSQGKHSEKVRYIQKQVKDHRARGTKEPLCTARPSMLSMRFRDIDYKKKNNTVVMDLYDIISIDNERQTIKVEPFVSSGQLTAFLRARGWTLPVVPELDDLTVGGLICGYGIETSSHKYGLFFDNVTACDVVLADGSVVTCTAENEYRDLFFGLPWSYGALGLLVSAELKIIPMQPYVELNYIPFKNAKDMYKEFTRLSMQADNGPMFVECLAFNKDESVLMVGEMTQQCDPELLNPIGRWWAPWFYTHVQQYLNKPKPANNQPFKEYIPLRDYYHRHSRSLFWTSELILPFGNHWLFRLLAGWLFPMKVGFLKMTQPPQLKRFYEQTHVFQDILVPITKFEEAMDYCAKNFDMYPIWLCPHKTVRTNPDGMLKPVDPKATEWEMYLDIGLYGPSGIARRGLPFDSVQALRDMEAYLRKIGGYQALYATTEMTRAEWEEMFDQENYRNCRKKYGGEGVFIDAYDKVKKPGRK